MQLTGKVLLLAVAVMALPAAAAVIAEGQLPGAQSTQPMANTTYRAKDKDQSRLPAQPFRAWLARSVSR